MKKFGILLTVLLIPFFIFPVSAKACTDIRITAKDGTVMIVRTLEFALDLNSHLRTSPRERHFTTTLDNTKPGLTWKAKYGYVFLDALNVDIVVDGMNEAGLSYEALYLPAYAGYQTIPAGKENKALPYLFFGDWALSQFKTVDEVKQALSNIYVVTQKVPGQGDMIFPIHFILHDATGKSIVVEYVDGKMSIYDNIAGVATNSPPYDWHMKNLLNYLHLAPMNPPAMIDNGVKFAVTGQGYGMLGLPGDISPPSRFIKAAVLSRVALPVDNSAGALSLSNHIINNFDIPKGLAREPEANNHATSESTQWTVFKDLMNKIIYYRTYDNSTLQSISLSKLDFSPNAKRLKMPIASQQITQDKTEEFLKSAQ